MKSLSNFATKAVKSQNTVKGGSNGKGTKHVVSTQQQHIPLL